MEVVMPFLINIAIERGWAWPLKLYSLTVKPWNGVYIPKKDKWGPNGYEAWVLRTKEQVRQVAAIFGILEKDIPWNTLNLEIENTLEDGNPVLYFGTKAIGRKHGKKKIVREIEFHRYVWDVNSYMSRTLATL